MVGRCQAVPAPPQGRRMGQGILVEGYAGFIGVGIEHWRASGGTASEIDIVDRVKRRNRGQPPVEAPSGCERRWCYDEPARVGWRRGWGGRAMRGLVALVRVLGLCVLAGCAGPSAMPPAPPAPTAPPASLPAATLPPVAGASTPAPPKDLLPDLISFKKSCEEGRFQEIHENADGILSTAIGPDLRLSVLAHASVADLKCRDFVTAIRHGAAFAEERERVGGDRDWRDGLALTAMAGGLLALADDQTEINQARVMLGIAAAIPDMKKNMLPYELHAAGGAAKPFALVSLYKGKYSGDQRLARGRERVEAALPGAFDRLRARLGAPDLEFPPVAVRFQDGEAVGTSAALSTDTYMRSNEPVAVVTVFTEHLVGGRWEAVTTLAHELAHGLRGAGMGISESPPWLEEGFAHWASRGDEEDLKTLAFTVLMMDPGAGESALTQALQDPPSLQKAPDLIQRAAGTYLFYYIERERGLDRARRLTLRLIHGEDHRKAFRDVIGTGPEILMAEARRDVPSWIARHFPRWREAAAILAACKTVDPETGLQRCTEFLSPDARDPESMAVSFARVSLLKRLRRWDDAISTLRDLQSWPLAYACVPSLRYGEIEFLRKAGRWEEVARIGKEVLRDIVWSDEEWEADIIRWVEQAEGKAER
jgi:hypothetical protein